MKKNAVAHFEIYADNPAKLQEFYANLFDWSFEQVPGMDYTFIKTVETEGQGMPKEAGGINGGMIARPAGYTDRAWVSYVNVESVDASTAQATSLGAKVMKPKTAVPGMGWFVMLTDPQGNIFAMWQTDSAAK